MKRPCRKGLFKMDKTIIDLCAIGSLQALQEAAFIGGVIAFVSFAVGYLLSNYFNHKSP